MEKNQKHKRNADDYKSIERLYLQPWLAERIRVANFDLVDHMKQVLISNPAFSAVYGVEMSQLAHLRRNDASLRSLPRVRHALHREQQRVEDRDAAEL